MKYNIKARAWVSVIFVMVTLCAWWLAGFNFDVRGGESVSCFFTTVVAFTGGITCPFFDKAN